MKIKRSKEDQERANGMFDSLRDDLLKRDLSNTENYDKAILTLSASALGISVAAIRFIVPIETAEQLWLMKTSWVLLVLSIATSLMAYLMSNKAIAVQMVNAEAYYIDGELDAFNRKNVYITVNSIINRITGILFIIAISAIVWFVVINVNQEELVVSKDDSGKTLNAGDSLDYSANVPTMQRVETSSAGSDRSASIPTMQKAPSSSTQQSGGSGSSSSPSSSETKSK